MLHCANDVVIAGAPAQVAVDGMANFGLARIRNARQEIHRAHDHARRTEAALKSVLLPKSFLHAMHRPIGRDALDRRHRSAVSLNRKHGAGLDTSAVKKNCTGSALTRVASDVRPGKAKSLAQEVHEEHARLDLVPVFLPIHSDADLRRGTFKRTAHYLRVTLDWELVSEHRTPPGRVENYSVPAGVSNAEVKWCAI